MEIGNDENSGLLMNISKNYSNATFNKNVSTEDCKNLNNNISRHKGPNNNTNIKEIKINLNSKEKSKIINKENQIFEKIIYIQKWWKIMYKIILIQKNVRKFLELKKKIKIVYLIKMIYKLLFCKVISTFRQGTIKNKKNKEFFNELKNNLKGNIIKKIKKFDTSSKFYMKGKLTNNSRTINSRTNNNFSKKKTEDNKKNVISENKESYKNKKTNNNEGNIKHIQLNKNENDIKTSYNKNKFFKTKFMDKTTYNINNKEKLKAYTNINNIYDNIKKIYEDYYNKTNCSSSNNFYIKNNNYAHDKNKNINKKIKNDKRKNEKIKIRKNSDKLKKETFKKSEQKKNDEIIALNIEKLKKKFELWKEYIIKKLIIEKLKNQRLFKSHLLLKNKFSKRRRKIISVTTTKLNLSNSILNQRLSNITPRTLNMSNNNQQKILTINNYCSDKKYKQNNSVNKNYTYSLINTIYSSNSHKNLFIKYHDVCHKNIGFKNPNNKNEKLSRLYKIIKLLEEKNNKMIKKYYLNKWKILVKVVINYGIEEKIIRFKKVKSPHANNSNNYLSNIFKDGNYSYQNIKTESNAPYNHVRANSITFQGKNLDIQTINNTFKGFIYKSNIKSQRIVYKKKLLNTHKTKNNYIEEKNLTLGNSLSELNLFNKTDEYINNMDNNNITYNSIYGGKFLNETTRNSDKLYNKIEEKEIYFTPKKNSIFKNSLGINVNIVENYLNINDRKKEFKRNNPQMNNKIKAKTIFFS